MEWWWPGAVGRGGRSDLSPARGLCWGDEEVSPYTVVMAVRHWECIHRCHWVMYFKMAKW